MRARRPSSALVVAAALVPVFLCGCDPAPRGEPIPGTARVYLSGDPASLTLVGKADGNSDRLAVQLTDSLVQYGPDLRLRPRVAESWSFSDDRRTLTFRLREGVRWHDGRPVTAGDVLFTVEQIRDPLVESRSWAQEFRDLEAVEAPDERTVRAHYRVATPDDLAAWPFPLLPRHLAEPGADLLTGAFSRHPVGCGPFRFVRSDAGQEIVLDANPDYWDGAPALERLVLEIFPDQRTAYQALLKGDLDVITLTSNLWADARDSPFARYFEARRMDKLAVWVVLWNTRDAAGPFADPAVRRAMVHALDRRAFLDGVVHGDGSPGVTTWHPGTGWADPELLPLEYDPAEAGRLLDAAGWIDADGDGVRERGGRPLAFTLTFPTSNQALADQIAAWCRERWGAVGARAELAPLEFQTLRERRNAGLYDALSLTLTFTINPGDQYDLYHSTATPESGGLNYTGFGDPEVDRLLDAARTTFDDDARRDLYRRIQQRVHELQPVTALFYFVSPVLHDRRLRGVELSPLGYLEHADGPRRWRWEPAR